MNTHKNLYCLVLNSNYIPIGIVNAQTAFKKVYTDTVDLIKVYDGVVYRSPNSEWAVPSIIRSKRYVKLPYTRAVLTKRNIFKRDSYCCQYCGEYGNDKTLTWDHILPKSKNGKNTWENLVTSCVRCNREKDNLTLDELGWFTPNTYHPHYLMMMNSFVKETPEEWKPYLMVGK